MVNNMKNVFFSQNFFFNEFIFSKYRYTDNSSGAPMNYIAYMANGTAKIVSKDITIDINEGDVFFIPKNLSYQSFWYGDKNEDIKFLSFGFIDLNTDEISNCHLQIVNCKDDLKEKIKSIPTFKDHATSKALSYFYDVMDSVIRCLDVGIESGEDKHLKRAKFAIYQNPHLSIREIAQLCDISEPYLYKIFKNTNMTPNEYRQIRLCELGIELLSTTDKKIEEICNILHFSSSSYFRKVLHKYTSLTPKQIRNLRKM
jgi:AraC-like DNA-binding protein